MKDDSEAGELVTKDRERLSRIEHGSQRPWT